MNISNNFASIGTYTRVSQSDNSARGDEVKVDEEKKQDTQTQELSEDEKRLVRDLVSRDTEVKAHEAAHKAVGGGLTGAASYTYQRGPDGKMYAIGGEVSISMKSGSTPEENISNARQIAAAAMAPANPSPQDYAVATSARVMEMKAQQQLTKEKLQELTGEKAYGDTQNEEKNSLDEKEDTQMDIQT
jgi:CRISPR/Cas system-associated exonuclease Cas4 (RecB family)